MQSVNLEQKQNTWHGTFRAMASPCEVIIETDDSAEAETIAKLVAAEVWRIEKKFSRYRDDNIIFKINNSKGEVMAFEGYVAPRVSPLEVDGGKGTQISSVLDADGSRVWSMPAPSAWQGDLIWAGEILVSLHPAQASYP